MKSLRRLLPYMRAHRRAYVLGILFTLLGSVMAAGIPFILKLAIDSLTRNESLSGILPPVLLLLGVSAIRGIVLFRSRFTLFAAARRVEYDLRNDLYRHLLKLPARFFDHTSSGDLSSRMINDLEGVRMVAGVSVAILSGTVPLFIASLVGMFLLDATLASLLIIPLLLIVAVTAIMTRKIFERSRVVQERLADLSTLAHENFSGARIVRTFSQEAVECGHFVQGSSRYRDANVRLARTRGLTNALTVLFLEAPMAIALYWGGLEILDHSLSLSGFTAFIAYFFLLSWPVIAAGWVISLIQRGAACMDRLVEILDTPPEETVSVSVPVSDSTLLRGDIEFRNLTFHYDEDRSPALKNLSLSIRAGERIALVGPTGSGKSTLIQMILGLYPPDPGTLLIDGQDINQIPRARLRRSIGCVPQELFLFSDPLSENISFGAQPDATPEKLREAAEISRISVDAQRFPDGLDQIIGERGVTLSGGQKQRTALARALIRNAPILLLDDAFSSVDVQTERDIIDRLEPLLRNRTCIIATHRFSILRMVDRIVVLDEGGVVETGTHEALLKSAGLYASLLDRQSMEIATEEAP